MTVAVNPHASEEYPFSARLRTSDRDELLVTITTAVWESILDFPLTVRDGHEPLEEGGRVLTGAITISGNWDGIVALSTSHEFAVECAARMFAKPEAEITPTEEQDAWGELVNMVAGNLKALVPPVTHLSLPTVVDGTTYTYRVPRARVLNEITFACLGSRFRLAVLQRDETR